MPMRFRWNTVAVSFALMTAAQPAHACIVFTPFTLEDIRFAEVVVVGRISNYEIVLDQEARQRRKDMLARSTDMPETLRKTLEEQTGFLGDYAAFDILVDEVLVGKAPKKVRATWDNSTYGEPATMPDGQYLVALRDPGSRLPPLRGPSATILANPEPDSLTVLQAPCSGAFILEGASEEAKAIRKMLPDLPK